MYFSLDFLVEKRPIYKRIFLAAPRATAQVVWAQILPWMGEGEDELGC
jgi:hypothetical protein